jgi:endonuclease/exonuclease/phosphatase family metal-dependent hydrolase
MEVLSVLTLNTWNESGEYQRRKPLIEAWIEKLSPDLIGFQEIGENQAAELLTGLGYQIRWAGHGESGLVVGAKWEIEEFAVHDLPAADSLQVGGIALSCHVVSPAGVIPFLNATTYYPAPHEGWKRELQMPVLLQHAKSARIKGGFPAVLVGDFNAEPESAEIRFLKGLQSLSGTSAYFCDAWERAGDGTSGATWTTKNPHSAVWGLPDRRIDYIFIGSPGVVGAGAVNRCLVVCDEPVDDVWPSDHFGVFAEMQVASDLSE